MKKVFFLALFAIFMSIAGTAQSLIPSSEFKLKRVFGFNAAKISWCETDYTLDAVFKPKSLKVFSLYHPDSLRYDLPSRPPESIFGSPRFDDKNFWRPDFGDLFENYNKFVDYVIVFEKGKIKLQKKVVFY